MRRARPPRRDRRSSSWVRLLRGLPPGGLLGLGGVAGLARGRVAEGDRGELVEARLPLAGQLAGLLGALAGEVARLGAVGRQVVELPGGLLAGGDELPVAHADRPVPLVLPPEGLVADRAVAGEGRHEALAGGLGGGRAPLGLE